MTKQKIRHAIIGLLMFTGIFHFAVALVGMAGAYTLPVVIFGFIYSALGYWVRKDVTIAGDIDGRRSIIVTTVITALALTGGGAQYLSNGGPGVLAFLFAIDFAIIFAGALWLSKARA